MSVNQLLVPNALDLKCRSITIAKGGSGGAVVNTPIGAKTFTSGVAQSFFSVVPPAGKQFIQVTILTEAESLESLVSFSFNTLYNGVIVCVSEFAILPGQVGPEYQTASQAFMLEADGVAAITLSGTVVVTNAANAYVSGIPIDAFVITTTL